MRDTLKLLQECMDRAVERKEVAGVSALVLRDGKEQYYAESGYADLAAKKPIQRDTIFHLYSQSKPITAAAVMLLVQDGLIDLCEPVADFIDSFKEQTYLDNGQLKRVPADKPVRLLDLMNMTSGLVYPAISTKAETETGLLMDKLIARLHTDDMMTTAEFAEQLGHCPLQFLPGSHFQYGTSADVLGAVIEKVTGQSFGSFLSERIFTPLEMQDTGFFVPDEKKARLSHVYRAHNGELIEYTGDRLGIKNNGDKNLFESGGAGLFSTLDDYAHFARMLMDGGIYHGERILKETAVTFLTSGKLAPFQQADFRNWRGLEGYTYGNLMRVLEEPGQAVLLGNRGEYGWDGWLGTYFMNDPSTRTTFLMMLQRFDYGTGHVTRRLRNIIM